MKWRHVPVVAASLAVAATGLAAAAVAPSAHADEGTAANEGINLVAAPLAGLFGPTLALPTPVCGTSNVVPLQIANLTDEIQTGSVTIGNDLTENVFFVPGGTDDSTCVARNGTGWYDQNGTTYANNFTVQPQSVSTLWLSMGGSTEAVSGSNRTFSIGGSPNGTAGQQWYDFNLFTNADNSFSQLTTTYENTGGTDPATNTQGFNGTGAFNVLSCTPQSVTTPTSIMTPYSSGNANGPTYYAGNPMCMGWVPAGETVPSYNVSSSVVSGPSEAVAVSVAAAQYNESLGTVSALLEVPGDVAVASVQAIDVNGAQVYLPSTPSSTGFYAQQGFVTANDDAGNTLTVEGIPAWANTQLLVTTTSGSETVVSLVDINTGAPNVAPAIATADTSSQVQDDPVDPLTTPTPVTSDYSVSILDANNPTLSSGQPSGNIVPGAEIVSVGDTSMSLQVGISVDGNAAIPNYPGGGATLTSVTMPDGSTQSYSVPVMMDGVVYTTINVPLLDVQTNEMYSGTFDFTLNFTYTNGYGFYFGVQVVADPPSAETVAQPTIEGPTYQDYSVSFSNPSWATLTGAPIQVNGPNLEVQVDVTPVASVLAEMQEYVTAGGEASGGSALTLQTLTLPSGVNKTIGASIDVNAFGDNAVPYTVSLPIADASGTYYTGTFTYTLTFTYGNGNATQATMTVTADPPSSS